MKKTSILIVDDLFANRFLLKKIIEQSNYNCIEANDGKQAIEMVEQITPDLIFMDIEMPVMNGFETTEFIRNTLNLSPDKLPIYALSSHDKGDLEWIKANDRGFNGVLAKPITKDKILDIFKHHFPL